MNKHLPTARGAVLADLALRLAEAARRRGIPFPPRPSRLPAKPAGRVKAVS